MKQTICTALLLTVLLLCSCGGEAAPEVAPTPSQAPQITVEAVPNTAFEPIDLGDGLTLTGLSLMAGHYPEDGSDEYRETMLCASFVNENAATLQYAKVNITVNGVVHGFELTTIPGGKSVMAFDVSGEAPPERVSELTAEAVYLVFFPEEPSQEEERLAISFGDGALTVSNISDEDIDQEISVYYKNTYDGRYLGGITYRVRVGTLKAGETASGYSSHASEGASEVMFVGYDH